MATTATMPPIYVHKHFFRRIFPGKPFFIQIFSAGALAAIGDILCQKLFEKRDKWDPFRTSPPTLTAAFLFSVNFLDSFSAQSAVQRTKRIYFDVLVNNYKFWPFVQMVNLTVIPLQFRVVFVQFFSIFWNIFLSFKTNN
uniref:Mitochondrial inner membrane protein Mpv17 n=1 Tax=Globodera pallida TaxID=36090 RepID=A0A183C0N3_GLOPA